MHFLLSEPKYLAIYSGSSIENKQHNVPFFKKNLYLVANRKMHPVLILEAIDSNTHVYIKWHMRMYH